VEIDPDGDEFVTFFIPYGPGFIPDKPPVPVLRPRKHSRLFFSQDNCDTFEEPVCEWWDTAEGLWRGDGSVERRRAPPNAPDLRLH
jgi:hypothetical protein